MLALVHPRRPRPAKIVRETHFVPTERPVPEGVRQDHKPAGLGDAQHFLGECPRLRDVLGHVRREADVDAAGGEGQFHSRPAHDVPVLDPGRGQFPRVRFDRDVPRSDLGEFVAEVAGPATDVKDRRPGKACGLAASAAVEVVE